MVRILSVALLVAAFAAPLGADVIHLKNGETFKGRIVRQTESEIQLETSPGAVLTFPRAQVENIETDRAPTPAAEAPKTPETASSAPPAKEFKDLQAQVAALQEEVRKLKDDVLKLREGQGQVATRTQQVAEPRGDQPGEKSSDLALVNMRWSRAGDTIKVEGAIRNTGGSPGKWVRIVAIVKDLTGNIIGRGETTPNVAAPGTTVRDVGWVVPGKDVAVSVFVPFGGYSKETTFSSTSDVARKPQRMPRLNEIRVDWSLEVPPKYAPPEGKGAEPAAKAK